MFFKIIITWIVTYSLVFACGGSFWAEDYELNFLHKRDFAFSNIDKNLKYSSVYNGIVRDANIKTKKKNIQEWQKEFGDSYSLAQVEEFLYKKTNLEKVDNKEILDYIVFLDKQSPYVSSWRDYYIRVGYKGKKIDANDVDSLIQESLLNMKKVKSDYLKVRYFFLSLRLAHYYNKSNASTIYMNNKELLTKSDSIVNDWIQGLYAGILVNSAQRVKGVYEFTKLFDESKLNWYLAYYNFKGIKTDKDWEKLFSMAKNNEEKAKFITLRALDPKSNIVEELQNIAAVDINSKYFDLLLFREVVKSQSFFDNYPKDIYYSPRAHNGTKFNTLLKYLKNISKDEMYTVDLSLAYFSFYKGDIKSSKEYLSKAYKVVKNDDIHELKALEYIIYLNELKTIDHEIENNIAKKLEILMKQECNKDSAFKYTFYIVKNLYKKQGDEFKYFVASNVHNMSNSKITLKRFEDIQALKEKKDKSGLEEYMLKKIIFSYVGKEEDLIRLHAKLLMNHLEFEKLLQMYPDKLNYKVRYNIFNNLIRGNNRRVSAVKPTVKEIVEKVIAIKQNLKKNPNNAMDNYLYATVIYNLSYWGNLNNLTTVYRSGYFFREIEREQEKINLSNYHLKKALENTNDKEFKAKITYMLAKNEIAQYDMDNAKEENNSFEGKRYSFQRAYFWRYSFSDTQEFMFQGYGKYFDKLSQNFNDTDYYKELIHGCAELRHYNKTLADVYTPTKVKLSVKKLEKKLAAFVKDKINISVNEYDTIYFWKLLIQEPLTTKTVTSYNNIAYYLNNLSSHKYSILLLEKILEKFPNRTVAYYNLGDAYWNNYDQQKAKIAYKKYVALMKKNGKENKIPQKVIERIKG